MNFDPGAFDKINFDPFFSEAPLDFSTSFIAEASIVRGIVQGSGGPENIDITEPGLRFVRHILCNTKSMRFGFMPNFKDMNSIREIARDYIRKCGGATIAMQTMQQVMQPEQAS